MSNLKDTLENIDQRLAQNFAEDINKEASKC